MSVWPNVWVSLCGKESFTVRLFRCALTCFASSVRYHLRLILFHMVRFYNFFGGCQRRTQWQGSTWVQIMYAVSHVTFCFFLCPISLFIRILLRHITFYKYFIYKMYITIIFYETFMSIFVFYNISTSTLQFFIRVWRHFLQFLSRLTSYCTTFKVAVSHFVFYPCGALVTAHPTHHPPPYPPYPTPGNGFES